MSISSSAVLVELNISVWTANKLDKGATDSVLASNSASKDSAQVRKNLMAGTDKRKKIADYAARARLYHNQTTLSWSDKGARLLPTILILMSCVASLDSDWCLAHCLRVETFA